MTTTEKSVEELMRNIPDPLTSEQYKAITQTLTAERQKRDEVVEAVIPKEKPMGVFSFVLRGEELEQYMRHKGWNECRDAMKEALTQPNNNEETEWEARERVGEKPFDKPNNPK